MSGWVGWLPGRWRTIRVRLAVTYSALLFGISALLLGGVYLALSRTLVAEPLDPVTVKRFVRSADGTVSYRSGETFQAADLDSVQRAVNYATLQNLRDFSIAALVVMFVISLLIGWWVAGRALRPVARITATAQEINATDLSRRIDAPGPPDELKTLADTIDGMLTRLEGAFRAERRLLADVSHELRNPVAVVQANVEAVLGHDDTPRADRREAAGVVIRATGRMSRLLDDLLAAARMRSTAFADSEVDLAGLIRTVGAEHASLAAQRSVRIDLRVADGPVAYADHNSLARALSNLLSNAVRYAPAGSAITVGLGSQQGWAWISVQDEGPGIPAQQRDQVFDRFTAGRTPTAPASAWRSPGRSSRATTGDCCSPTASRRAARSSSGCPSAVAGTRERASEPPRTNPAVSLYQSVVNTASTARTTGPWISTSRSRHRSPRRRLRLRWKPGSIRFRDPRKPGLTVDDDDDLAVVAQVGALVSAAERLHGKHQMPVHADP